MLVGVRALVLGLLLAMCGSALGLSFVPTAACAQGEPLRVGTYIDNMPWGFRNDKGEIVGFDIDLVQQIGRSLGRPVDFQSMAFRDLFTALASNRIDLAVSSISITSERLAYIDFTQSYYETAQGVLVMKKSGMRDVGDLAGKNVSVTSGTTSERWVTANAQRYGFGRTSFSQGSSDGVRLLEAGAIDAYVGDLPTLLYQLLKRPDLAVIARLPSQERYGIALAKDSPLTAKVDAAITRMKQDGTLARIHKRWFGMAPDKDSATTKVLPRP
ncbi:amino acid ABC transporter substrate-binding protein [Starkeya sp. ORNL1]|uniref:ABC transporter substrate-binding protein n=1 Tax=Starkeya sp. ORNL1 TaxID=2709380 RepID=UPI0014633609|nr:transporter substrate-binding domain-containing protein [Starkeya sp. ORNL1]QJP16420.1 amino acid ABC transporter substrate-binding protein [Starkeya sp. ORNL1]